MEYEGEPTAESPTAESKVVPPAESIQHIYRKAYFGPNLAENEGVTTDESHAAKMEVVLSAKSPN